MKSSRWFDIKQQEIIINYYYLHSDYELPRLRTNLAINKGFDTGVDYRRLLGTGKRKTQLLKYCMQCYISNLRSRTPCMRPQCVPKLDLFLLRPELKGIVTVFVFRWKVKSYLQKKRILLIISRLKWPVKFPENVCNKSKAITQLLNS